MLEEATNEYDLQAVVTGMFAEPWVTNVTIPAGFAVVTRTSLQSHNAEYARMVERIAELEAQIAEMQPVVRLEEWASQGNLMRGYEIERWGDGRFTVRVQPAGGSQFSRTRFTLPAAIEAALKMVEGANDAD